MQHVKVITTSHLTTTTTIQPKSSCVLENEVACIDVSPLQNKDRADFCAIGMWNDVSVKLLALPDLKCIYTEQLAGGSLVVVFVRRRMRMMMMIIIIIILTVLQLG